MPLNPDTTLAEHVRTECGENVYLCYQCKKCAAGCPVATHFDLAPHQILRAAQLGQRTQILSSKTIWLCAICETCATRCPQGIDITRIMVLFRAAAYRERIRAGVPAVPALYSAALRGIGLFGRMYELGMMGELHTRLVLAGDAELSHLIGHELPIAWRMWRKGKLKLLPALARGGGEEWLGEGEAIAYYPGCSLHGTSVEYDMSTKSVSECLGLTLVEPQGWKCCGASFAHSTDHMLATELPLHNLARIEEEGQHRVTVPCPSCYLRHQVALEEVREDGEFAEQVKTRTSYSPSPEMEVEHLLMTITERVGYDRVARAVATPLSGMRVVCYYGCTITRPPKLTGVRDYEYPVNMDRLMKVLGAEPLDWSHKTECCGASLSVSQTPIALEMSNRVLRDARSVGAEAIVVACPLCQTNLDLRQEQINSQLGEQYDLPIVYFTQLMGLAFALDPKALGLEMHFVDTSGLYSYGKVGAAKS